MTSEELYLDDVKKEKDFKPIEDPFNKEFLTVHETKKYLGVSRSFLYRLKDSKLQAYALGRKTYFKKSDLNILFKPR